MGFGAIEAGKAFLKVFVDDKDVAPAFDRIQSKAGSFVTTFGRIAGPAAAIGTAFAAASAVAIKYASDAQETMSKFNVVFGQMSSSMKSFGDNLADQMGRSKYAVAGSLASFQDLLVPMGMAPQAAAEMSKTLATLAIDLGSFNNMVDADVIRDLQAALTGSGEVMKKYGVIVSEAAVKQELLNMKLSPAAATEAEKAQARLNIIMRGTTAAQGDAMRTAGGYANQMKRLNDNAHDAAVELGNMLLPAATELAKKAAEAAKRTGEWADTLPDSVTLLDEVALSATGAVGGVFQLAEAFEALNKKLGTTASLFSAISPLIDAYAAIGAKLGIGNVTRAMPGPKKPARAINGADPTGLLLGPAMDYAFTHSRFVVPPGVSLGNEFGAPANPVGNPLLGKLMLMAGLPDSGEKKFNKRMRGWFDNAVGAAGMLNPLPDIDVGRIMRKGKGLAGGDLVKGMNELVDGVQDLFSGKSQLTSSGTFSAAAVGSLQGGSIDAQILDVNKQQLAELRKLDRKDDPWKVG